jgi:hypothetical protein
MHDLNAPEQYRRVLAEVKILATIQKRSNMEKFPGIARWMLENVEPVYERFHDRELRTDIKKKAERLQESGDLPKIVLLFDNPAVYQEDNTNFRKAMRLYHDLETESNEMEKDLGREESFGKETGHSVAAFAAGAIALLAVIIGGVTLFGGGAKPF